MGNLIRNYPIPIVFKTIWFKRSSGELLVRGGGFSKRLFFLKGNLEYAAGDLPHERLGVILHGKGILTNEHLQRLSLVRWESRNEKIGQILVREGIVTQRELYHCLMSQSKMVAAATFGQDEGEWEFVKGIPAIPSGQRFTIPLPQVIIEGAGRISDFAVYRSLLSLNALNVAKLPKSLAQMLSPFDLQFYQRFVPYSGKMAAEIQDKFTIAGDVYWKKVVLFYLLNVFEFNEGVPLLASETETLIVGPKGLERMASRSSRSANSPAGLEYSEIVLPDTAETPPSPQIQPFSVSADWQKRAKAAYQKARQLYEEEQYREAAALLADSIRPDFSPTSYVFLLGLCQAKVPEWRRAGESHLKLAAEREPWNAEPHYALGELYRAEGMLNLAKAAFRRALEINQDHTGAGRDIREIEGGRKKR